MGLNLKPTPKQKEWFTLEWGNKYIQLWIIALILLCLQIINYRWSAENVLEALNADTGHHYLACALVLFGTCIPATIVAVISYKGFYQFWKDDQSGKTR